MSHSLAVQNISDLHVPDDKQTKRDRLTDKNPHDEPSALTILLCFHDNWPQHGSEGSMFFLSLALSNEANWIILSIYLCTQQSLPPIRVPFITRALSGRMGEAVGGRRL